MAGRIYELRPRAADNEKITINLGHVDLGHIDLLVQEGTASNVGARRSAARRHITDPAFGSLRLDLSARGRDIASFSC
jgi:Ribbon-Helix-Helix transcriptional regulator family